MGVAVEAQPSREASLPISQGGEHSVRSDAYEEAIQACYALLSSGRPLAEILIALKRLGPFNKDQLKSRDVCFDTQNSDLGEPRSHSWVIDHAAPSVEANLSLVPFNVSRS